MKLSEELAWRGFIQQSTYEDISKLDEEKSKVFYHGFDASADSQTVGNLAAMMMDKVFLRHGWKAILLAGGATSLIGDPGGKDKERPLQDARKIAENISVLEEQLKRIIKEKNVTFVNNLDWYQGMNLLEFLRDVGKHFSMTPLVQRDYIAKRMGTDGSGITYTEFSYTLLQGYDFLKLNRDHKVVLQLAGSDQWGNGISGVDLIRRVERKNVNVITMPLIINKQTGKKFGKTEEGALWLDENKTSVYKFYQFWLNIDDDNVSNYLKIYTELDKKQIADVMQEFLQDKSSRYAQRVLAYEITKIVHGKQRADSVVKATNVLFGELSANDLSQADIDVLSKEIPILETSSNLVETLKSAGLASSNSEALRFINEGSVSVNGVKCGNDVANFESGYNLVKRGKNSFALIKSA